MRIHILSIFRSPKAKAQAALDRANAEYEKALSRSRSARQRGDTRSIGAALASLHVANHRRLKAEMQCARWGA